MKKSALQQVRDAYCPKLPAELTGNIVIVEGKPTQSVADQDEIRKLFPNTYGLPELNFERDDNNTVQGTGKPVNVGVILSGGQAPGGHNVICGLFDGIKSINPESRLYGFLMGPSGLVDHKYKELTADIIDEYRNTGGFDMIGSGRTKLEEKEQFDKGLEILKKLNIDALVIIGGDDSNTNAAVLAEYYKSINAGVRVIGCPKTIDGDLKNSEIEVSFGFDTATKVYGELIGNVQRDCNSSRKYWHFMKLMGRSASHIALECALQTQPNVCIISEEVEAENQTLNDIVDQIAGVVARRAAKGLNFGTVLIPEGLIEFIPAVKRLISELNDMIAAEGDKIADLDNKELRAYVLEHLSEANAKTYSRLPHDVARQLTLDRDPHGNVQVSLIETEKLISRMVADRLEEMREAGEYNGKFSTMHHFFGYEGRCSFPSNFDANYCYGLGYNAAGLVKAGVTGYMTLLRDLTKPVEQWVPGGIPITMMMNMERRNGEMKPVIQKALVKLDGAPFKKFASQRDQWAVDTCYIYPGPIQYFGPAEICDRPSMTLMYEAEDR